MPSGDILAERCGAALRQPFDQRAKPGALKHLLWGGHLASQAAIDGKFMPEEDIVVQGDAVAGKVLVDDGEEAAQLWVSVLADLPTIDQDAARLYRVEPGDQAGQGGFAAAIGADQGIMLARLKRRSNPSRIRRCVPG